MVPLKLAWVRKPTAPSSAAGLSSFFQFSYKMMALVIYVALLVYDNDSWIMTIDNDDREQV